LVEKSLYKDLEREKLFFFYFRFNNMFSDEKNTISKTYKTNMDSQIKNGFIQNTVLCGRAPGKETKTSYAKQAPRPTL
jgi:hypothetical protein